MMVKVHPVTIITFLKNYMDHLRLTADTASIFLTIAVELVLFIIYYRLRVRFKRLSKTGRAYDIDRVSLKKNLVGFMMIAIPAAIFIVK